MFVYRDMTFCNFLSCADENCKRRLTAAVQQAADLVCMPISMFVEKPDCYKEKYSS